MAKYVYPAIFTQEDNGYCVTFPDVSGCYTDGNTINEAMENAEDVLNMMLCNAEDKELPINPPSMIKSLKVDENSFVTLISADTTEYRKLTDNKLVKKTLTIPNWLNIMAEKQDINFSAVLRKALEQELQLH